MSIARFFLLVLLGLSGALAQPPAKKFPEELRALQGRRDARAVEQAWPYLDSPEPSIREAARRVVEALAFDSWKQRALGETRTWASLEALRALAEACPRNETAALRPHVCEGVSTLRIEEMNPAQRLAAVRLTRLVFARLGPPSADERQQMADLWARFVPRAPDAASDAGFVREVRQLLKFLAEAP